MASLLANILSAFKLKKESRAITVYCNYRNNYYGDQHCINELQ